MHVEGHWFAAYVDVRKHALKFFWGFGEQNNVIGKDEMRKVFTINQC